MIFTENDLSAILEPFEIITIANRGTDSEYILKGVFDNAYKAYDGLGEISVSTTSAILRVKDSDITNASLTFDSSLFLENKTYRISDIQDDGWGYSKLILKDTTTKNNATWER